MVLPLIEVEVKGLSHRNSLAWMRFDSKPSVVLLLIGVEVKGLSQRNSLAWMWLDFKPSMVLPLIGVEVKGLSQPNSLGWMELDSKPSMVLLLIGVEVKDCINGIHLAECDLILNHLRCCLSLGSRGNISTCVKKGTVSRELNRINEAYSLTSLVAPLIGFLGIFFILKLSSKIWETTFLRKVYGTVRWIKTQCSPLPEKVGKSPNFQEPTYRNRTGGSHYLLVPLVILLAFHVSV
jgi:hypothetical protein